jgi:saccharopine dehydrogenase (NAD+, L-lysine-forming)
MTKTLLIRAEDKNRWERRAPIVPTDLADILEATGARAFVEVSDKRFFGMDQYAAAGAASCEGMADGEVILGVKEIPVEKILDNKTYLFFSHTIKGQKDNMPLLQRIIDSGSTLIDYEKITDDQGRRLIYFGPYAGDAGAIDILSLMGEHWADKGIDTPFAAVRRAHQYDSVRSGPGAPGRNWTHDPKRWTAPGTLPLHHRHSGLRQCVQRRPADLRLSADRARRRRRHQ